MTAPIALVVDDDPDIRDVIEYMLEQAGFNVHLESDGESGLAAALELEPSVVLLDWMMPRLSGVEVCRILRSKDQLAAVPVIILTAKAQESEVEVGFIAGADDYIVKPFSPRHLVRRVQAAVAQGRNA